jgi:glycosyltransferase involved in cell wall biosynthesis
VLADGLALGVMPAQVQLAAQRLRLVALVHHPLAMESGLSPGTTAELEISERTALSAALKVVVTSRQTAMALGAYDVNPTKIAVVEPGTDPAPLAHGSGGQTLHLLCVAAIVPRKGHALLLSALTALRDRPWQLTCVGSLLRDPATVAQLKKHLTHCGLTSRVHFVGDVTDADVSRAYDEADLFVLASHHEGYGMAVAEAIAHGLPVIATRTGAIENLVGTNAGLIAPLGDRAALTTALSRALDDPVLRNQLAAGARVRRKELPSWENACSRMNALLELAADA